MGEHKGTVGQNEMNDFKQKPSSHKGLQLTNFYVDVVSFCWVPSILFSGEEEVICLEFLKVIGWSEWR